MSSRAGKLPSSRLTISPWLRAAALELFPGGWDAQPPPAPPQAAQHSEGGWALPRGLGGIVLVPEPPGPGDNQEVPAVPWLSPLPCPSAAISPLGAVCSTRSSGFSPQLEPLTEQRKQSCVWLIPVTSASPRGGPASAAVCATSPSFHSPGKPRRQFCPVMGQHWGSGGVVPKVGREGGSHRSTQTPQAGRDPQEAPTGAGGSCHHPPLSFPHLSPTSWSTSCSARG